MIDLLLVFGYAACVIGAFKLLDEMWGGFKSIIRKNRSTKLED